MCSIASGKLMVQRRDATVDWVWDSRSPMRSPRCMVVEWKRESEGPDEARLLHFEFNWHRREGGT